MSERSTRWLLSALLVAFVPVVVFVFVAIGLVPLGTLLVWVARVLWASPGLDFTRT